MKRISTLMDQMETMVKVRQKRATSLSLAILRLAFTGQLVGAEGDA